MPGRPAVPSDRRRSPKWWVTASNATRRSSSGVPRPSSTPEEPGMQFGLFMMPLHPPHRAFADAYERDVEQIVLADQLGFREAWIGEHLTERWDNAPAPDLLIAQALKLIRNVKLGTGVTLL